MTRMKEGVFLVTILACFILIPFLPSELLMLSDLILVRLVLLGVFLTSMNISPLVGMLTFACIGFLFIERNKKKVMSIQNSMQSSPDSDAIRNIITPETAPDQPPYDVPQQANIAFAPNADSGDNSFAPVAESINTKTVLPTKSADGAKFSIKESFDWVITDLVQQ